MDFTPSRRTQAAATQHTAIRPRYEKLAPVKRRRSPSLLPRNIFRIVIIAIVVGAATYGLTHLPHGNSNSKSGSSSNTVDQGQVTQANPDFTALTPDDKKVTWTKLAPPNTSSFYAYSDTLKGVPIRVSEQTLPDNFKENPTAQLAQLARDYNANRTVTVNTTTVYIGTSVKGQQSILFTQDSLLIMITSDATLNDQQWTDYITSLN